MIALYPLAAIGARTAILFLLGRRQQAGARGWLELVAAPILLYGAFQIAALLAHDYQHPPEWDFPAFYLDAAVGASGMNIHEPGSYREVAPTVTIPVALGDEFVHEITEVGFLYPTPSMFLFVPLRLFEFDNAHAVWIGFLGLGLILAVVYTWRWLDREHSWQSLLLIGVLLVYMGPTWLTAEFEQTNYLNLILITLFLSAPDNRTRGLIAGLAPFVKPIMGFLALGLILERRWPAVRMALIANVAAFGLAGLVFGFDSVASYFLHPPNGRLPLWVYTQDVNQSLLAGILRATGETDPSRIGSGNPLFLLAALCLTLPTLLVASHLLRRGQQLGYALLLMLALLLYPSSLVHYGVLTIVPVLFLLKERQSWMPLLVVSACGGIVLTLLESSGLLGDLSLWLITLLIALATALNSTTRSGAAPA